MPDSNQHTPIADRFRGFYPVVVDVETGGFNAKTDALLEIAAVTLQMNEAGKLVLGEECCFNVEPFEGAHLEPAALEFTGIDPYHPLRDAKPEDEALKEVFRMVRANVKKHLCNRAILVGHNSSFDLGFVKAASDRQDIKRNPFHPFSSFDTATLAGLAYGQTVLAKACKMAGLEFDNKEAHTALYDARKTAELFCAIVNEWQALGGWPR